MDKDPQDQPDLEESEAAVLPAREAMSIITPDTSATGFLPDLGPAAGATPDGTVAAQDVASDAQGSASESESSSSENQSTHTTNQDTATSTT